MSAALRPTPTDGFPTETSRVQHETEEILAKHVFGPATLNKNAHMQFLARNLVQGFPARYVSQDASQPWLMFWTFQAFSVLQVGLDPGNRQRAIDTILAWQHPDGGFGGGPGQNAHLLPTYASVCALAIAGRPGSGGGWDDIDRQKMYSFFMSLKQPDGSFLVSRNAEVDVRGTYCLIVTAILLDICTPELVEGTASFVASCQTYEGGFSSASQPYFAPGTDGSPTLLPSPRPQLGEAHGGYTYCSLAAWTMLQPFIARMPEPKPSINLKALLRWCAHMQGTEIELGGFKGRTNKLVDGCYSWWVGGCFALLQSLGLNRPPHPPHEPPASDAPQADDGNWDDVDGVYESPHPDTAHSTNLSDSLFNRKALQEYILYAGQHPSGGLRDKPPKGADAYHTLYCLAGLSAAQHPMIPSPSRRDELAGAWTDSDEPTNDLRKSLFLDMLCYAEEEGASKVVGGPQNRVNATHPVFNLTMTHAEGMMAHFYKQQVPPRKPAAAAK
ncbi:terpenoid cyclases/protein prenyltransferase alpha-alpha toroid [Schizophyllum commune]